MLTTTTQIVVIITIESLKGEDMVFYSKMGQWGIGGTEKTTMESHSITKAERKYGFHPGYGLEGQAD
jgi:hypothetical protein